MFMIIVHTNWILFCAENKCDDCSVSSFCAFVDLSLALIEYLKIDVAIITAGNTNESGFGQEATWDAKGRGEQDHLIVQDA